MSPVDISPNYLSEHRTKSSLLLVFCLLSLPPSRQYFKISFLLLAHDQMSIVNLHSISGINNRRIRQRILVSSWSHNGHYHLTFVCWNLSLSGSRLWKFPMHLATSFMINFYVLIMMFVGYGFGAGFFVLDLVIMMLGMAFLTAGKKQSS